MLKSILLENFFLLLGICLVINTFIFYTTSAKATRIQSILRKITPILSIILLLTNLFVITDKEAIIKNTKTLAQACKAEDTKTISTLIDEKFSADSFDKQSLLTSAKEAFSHLNIKSLHIVGIEVQVPKIRFIVYSHIVSDSGTDYGNIRSDWELTFIKRGSNWLLFSARPLSVNLHETKNLHKILNLARSVW